MAHTVVGVYDNYSQAQEALNELTNNGFSIEHVNLSPVQDTREAREEALRSHRSEDEGITGSIAGFFRSLFGSPEHEQHADKYSEAIRRGSYLLTVHADSDAESERATEIMNRHEPFDVDERASQWQSQGWSEYQASAPVMSDAEIAQERSRYASSGMESGTQARMPDMTPDQIQGATSSMKADQMRDTDIRTGGSTEGKTAIPVIQEELQVGKRVAQRGGVRVYQHVTEQPVQEQVQLREEHVSVNRRPVDQPATDASLANMKDASFEVREMAEEPVIAKTARVVEEVVVGKDVKERTETVSDSVRRSDVEIEQLGNEIRARTEGTTGMTLDDSDFRTHWQSNYAASGGRYEDYAPAYQYGSRLANDERYRTRGWNDVEPNVQQDWESNNAGHPWERVKDAVRYGWEKVSH
ncbi:MAG TPA: YsnF/AvaK domain-containing protein [Paucimonas sp.]|nr:YsnF/AvaK domain-containing protein [Paucimonas sp.]